MNTKFSFILLVVSIALFVAACSPTSIGVSAPVDPAPLADGEILVPVPVTGDSAAEAERAEPEPRLFSGEIFQSDNNNPDAAVNVQTEAQQDLQNGCISEDSLPRPQSGCVE